MADPLTKFGLSRRPASELFGPSAQRFRPLDVYDVEGVPDFSRPGWATDKAVRAAADRQALIDEEMALENERAALEDERIARERQREAEAVADEFTRIKEPSAREKFFDENEATMTGSRRYSQLADIRQRQPSYADKTLANNIANKIDDPDERNVFLSAVSQGLGTLAAREEADRFRLRRGAVAALTKVGVHPTEANRIVDEEGYSPEVVNYYTSQRKKESSRETDADPAIAALIGHQKALSELSGSLITNPIKKAEVDAKLAQVTTMLADKFESIYNRTPPAAGAAVDPVATSETPEQKAARLRKQHNIE